MENNLEWSTENYIVKPYQSLTKEEHEQFYRFLAVQSQETDQPASENMWADDWENKPGTVPYLLNKTGDFIKGNGEMFVVILKSSGKVIGMSGISRSHFHEDIALGGVRTWIKSSMRNRGLPREHLLPRQKHWAIKYNYKIVALTFNEYNKNIIQIFKRSRFNEPLDKEKGRLPRHLFYNGLMEVPFPVKIMGKKQWVIYEKFDHNWDFDWETIRWDD